MTLVEVKIPSPRALRGGWAALAAVHAAQGWVDDIRATPERWLYHDGGGNWACLRFAGGRKAVLFGRDHEYSATHHGGRPSTSRKRRPICWPEPPRGGARI